MENIRFLGMELSDRLNFVLNNSEMYWTICLSCYVPIYRGQTHYIKYNNRNYHFCYRCFQETSPNFAEALGLPEPRFVRCSTCGDKHLNSETCITCLWLELTKIPVSNLQQINWKKEGF